MFWFADAGFDELVAFIPCYAAYFDASVLFEDLVVDVLDCFDHACGLPCSVHRWWAVSTSSWTLSGTWGPLGHSALAS